MNMIWEISNFRQSLGEQEDDNTMKQCDETSKIHVALSKEKRSREGKGFFILKT